MNNYKHILKKVKPTLDVDKGLLISELQRENAQLHKQVAQLTKDLTGFKKQSGRISKIANLSEKKLKSMANKELTAKYIKRRDHLVKQNEDLKKSLANRKRKHHESCLEHNFLKQRVKDVFGRKAFMDLVNHIDNPRYDGIIKDHQGFLNYKKKRGQYEGVFIHSNKYLGPNNHHWSKCFREGKKL